MAIFDFPQLKREPFWQYLSRLHDYCAQYVYFMYEKWEICDAVLESIMHETLATSESMCYGGLCSLTIDGIWNLFEFLSSYQWQYVY